LSLSRADEQFLTAVCAAAALAHARLEQMMDSSAPLQPQELALQCSKCGSVEAWRPAASACACGGRWDRAALPDIVAGRFRLDRLLGAGGMGVVYRAQDPILRRDVAVKTLPSLSSDTADRLLEEARAMAAMSHTHIAVLYGAEQWRGTPVLMVEYLEGGTLADRLRGGRLPIDGALEIACALADALAYIHATNRFHGDIKPSNIGFKNGIVKFMDFGLSRTMQPDVHADHPTGGTLAYLSPEVLNGAPAGAGSDVWALSVTLFQMLTGFHPFMSGSDTVARIRAGLVDLDGVHAMLPSLLVGLLKDLLSAASDARPTSASAMLERMTGVQNTLAARSHV
jgi:serine/threonine protein kinase